MRPNLTKSESLYYIKKKKIKNHDHRLEQVRIHTSTVSSSKLLVGAFEFQ